MGSDLPTAAARVLAPLPIGYHHVMARLLDVVGPDRRIRAVWLGGSLGRGAADAGSDLDVVLTIADADVVAFRVGWRDWLATVTPTILAHEIPGMAGSFFSVTAGCERLDVVIEAVSDLGVGSVTPRVAVLDRDGLGDKVSSADPEPRHPDPVRLAGIVEEFLRQQAIFPAAVVARADWLLGVVAVTGVQRMLYELLVETNQPLAAMGIKQWSSRLTVDQRALLESLPVPQPTRGDVVAAMLAARTAMRTSGRRSATASGLTWPVELDDAVAAYVQRELGWSEPAPASASAAASASASASASSAADAASSLRTSATTRIASPGA